MDWTVRGSVSRYGKKISVQNVRTGPGAIHPLIPCVPDLRFRRGKRPRHEANDSVTPSADVKNELSKISATYICLHGIHRDSLYSYFVITRLAIQFNSLKA